jgi:hypothetical protein
MRKLFLILFLVTVGFTFWVQAQSAVPYTLIEPDAAQYTEQIETIASHANTSWRAWDESGLAEIDVLTDEIFWRFIERDEISFAQLMTIYRAVATDSPSSSNSERLIPPLIELWIAEHDVRLHEIAFLEFEGFIFEIWQLRNSSFFSLLTHRTPFLMTYSETPGTGYIAVLEDSGHVRLPSLFEMMRGHIIVHGDINGDSQIDFAYVSYSHIGNSYTAGQLVVVTWTDGNFETIATVPFYNAPYEFDAVRWQFAQLDNEVDTELVQTQRMYDNWRCQFIRTTYYDWQAAGELEAESIQDTFPQAFNCLFRRAEEYAWQHNYISAIPLYEAALQEPNEMHQYEAYLYMRLGLAYLIVGRSLEAEAMFARLFASIDETSPEWITAFQQHYALDSRLLPVCQALYDQATSILAPYDITGTVGVSDGGFYGAGSYDPGFDLSQLSCDLPYFLTQELAPVVFQANETPLIPLERLGLVVQDTLIADFDADGQDEWIVWLASPGIDPLLFVPALESYTLMFLDGLGMGDLHPVADLRPPSDSNQYSLATMPDGTPALIQVDFDVDEYFRLLCSNCGGGDYIACPVSAQTQTVGYFGEGDITFWRLEGDVWSHFFFARTCQWVDPDDVLEEGGTYLVAGDVFPVGEYEGEVRPIRYQWDAELRTYVAPPQPTTTPFPTLMITSTPTPTRQLAVGMHTYLLVRTAFTERDFLQMLTIIDDALAHPPLDDSLVVAFMYYRALALEALGRSDEALAQYVAIYEMEPDSAWGVLARLHFVERQ